MHVFISGWNLFDKYVIVDLLAELARREKEAGIFPEAELDLFMKVVLIMLLLCPKD